MSVTNNEALGVGAPTIRADIADPAGTTNATSSGAIFVNAWVVSDGYQDEFVETIVGLLEYVRTLDGFIEGELLGGVNPTRFLSYVRMRSARHRQRLVDDTEVTAMLRRAGQIARPNLHSYDVLRAYGPAGA